MTRTSGPAVAHHGPIDPRQRIEAIDMIRGFALFGVLLVNMYNFGAYSPIWTGAGDRVAFGVMRVLFETKSWRLFALLFGLGFALQLGRASGRGSRFLPPYLRRLTVLFVIGMGHALLFPGDVLMVYAELGLLLLLFRNASGSALVFAAVALLALYPLGRAANTLVSGDVGPAAQVVDVERARAVNAELRRTHPHAVGSLLEVVRANARVIPPNPFGDPLGLESGLGFLAMFLLGLHLGRARILADLDAHLRLLRCAAAWGLSLGVLGMVGERALTSHLSSGLTSGTAALTTLTLTRDLAFTYGSTALALAYAAAIALLARSGRFPRLLGHLGSVGRLALTVYLTQTLAFTLLFYGYGLGQAFRLGPAAVTGHAILIFAAQVAACAWWVRRFRFGPAEWLWRALTYLELPRMRIASSRP